jgi:hypothetical protein
MRDLIRLARIGYSSREALCILGEMPEKSTPRVKNYSQRSIKGWKSRKRRVELREASLAEGEKNIGEAA